MPSSQLKGKILFIRLHRLGHIPSAKYSAEILTENRLPVIVAEFGYTREKRFFVPGSIPRLRYSCPWIHYLPKKLRVVPIFLSVLVRLLVRVALTGRPRLIIAHGTQEQVMAWVLSKVFGIPFIVHVHEVYDSGELTPVNRLFLLFEKSALNAAKFLIFSEKERARIYQQRYGLTQRIFFAANCPRKREKTQNHSWRERLHIPQKAPVLLYVGGIGEANPLELGIEAVARKLDLYFVLIGWSNPERVEALRAMAKGLGVTDRVLFLGEVEDKWPYLDGSTLGFCIYHPNQLRLKHLATASNKLMESLAAGLPVLAHGSPDFREIVEGYRVGACLSKNDPDEMVRLVRRLLADLKPYSFRARRTHTQLFHYEAQYTEILEEIKTLTPSPEPASTAQDASQATMAPSQQT